jgi:hypothetical protein
VPAGFTMRSLVMLPARVSLDEAGRILRMSYTIPGVDADDPPTALTTELSDFGIAVTIAPPPAADMADAPRPERRRRSGRSRTRASTRDATPSVRGRGAG